MLKSLKRKWDYLTGKSRTKIIPFEDFKIHKTKALLSNLQLLRFYKNGNKTVKIFYHPLKKDVVYLDTLVSLDRGKGYGTEAMKYFLKKMKQKGKKRVVLHFAARNNPIETAEFLTKFGFKRVPSTANMLILDALQKKNIDALAKSKPNKSEAIDIVNNFERSPHLGHMGPWGGS